MSCSRALTLGTSFSTGTSSLRRVSLRVTTTLPESTSAGPTSTLMGTPLSSQ